jgi:hypothetical protein
LKPSTGICSPHRRSATQKSLPDKPAFTSIISYVAEIDRFPGDSDNEWMSETGSTESATCQKTHIRINNGSFQYSCDADPDAGREG